MKSVLKSVEESIAVVESVVVESVVDSDENPLMRIWSAIGELGTSRVRVESVRSVKSVREEGSEREVAEVSEERDGIWVWGWVWDGGIKRAGFRNVLYVDPREVYLYT